MPILSIRLYLYAALLAAIAGGGFWLNHVLNERAQLKEDLKASNLSRDTAIAAGFQYQENNERQTKLLSDYQVKLDEKQAANSALERDVASGKRKLLIKGASCSAGSATTNSSTVTTDPVYSPEFRSNLFYIRSGIIKLEENYALCLQILNEDRKKSASN